MRPHPSARMAPNASPAALLSFGAIVEGDVRFKLKRPAAYALMAVNSEVFLVSMFAGFSFITLPSFTALIMGDPVVRDFEIGVDPLIFSTPVTRAQYLFGKFVGNFLVLVGCQACFALTFLVLQPVHLADMLVLPARVLP